ncbi:hypothetical protein [Stutzerimonas stutzeri]|jgi:hypothetical protein|nr:hypothetical protein [Stutzerimonas stutzeri]MBS9726736.1 hypothetical protein [Stutzerimonas stutzeri]
MPLDDRNVMTPKWHHGAISVIETLVEVVAGKGEFAKPIQPFIGES